MKATIIMTAHQHLRLGIILKSLAASVCIVVFGSLTNAQKSQASGGARTEDHANKIELTVFAGALATALNEESGRSLIVKTGVPVGGRVAYNFDDHHGVEFSVANPLSVYGNYVYGFSTSRAKLIPYLTAGFGASRYTVELSDLNSTPNNITNEHGPDRRQTAAFTANFGGGVEYFVTDKFGLRFDARDIVALQTCHVRERGRSAPGWIVQGRRTQGRAMRS